uniref:Chitin-binding type-2 domain-containing protein n=1 Tax=Scylla olivacea TaxID=85551 RepID=A0A0P4X0G8_SCYOL
MAPRSCLLLLLLCLVPGSLSLELSPVCGTDPCVTDCQNCADGEMVADPEDCHRFYICDGNGGIITTQPLECPSGMHFNATQHQCVSGNICKYCDRCFFECYDSITGMVPDPTDCSVYYECNGDYPGKDQTCSATRPYFDGFRCQEEHNRCCSCHAYCDSHHVSTFIPDPTDCRNYYYCMDAGQPAFGGTCDTGEFYDEEVDKCSPHAQCNTICKNFVNDIGCIENFECVAIGFFPKCPSLCTPEYYHCTSYTNTYIDSQSCPKGYDFHPLNHVCVPEDECP